LLAGFLRSIVMVEKSNALLEEWCEENCFSVALDNLKWNAVQRQQAVTREGLIASKQAIEEEMEQCHQAILSLHADLDATSHQNNESRLASSDRFDDVRYDISVPLFFPGCLPMTVLFTLLLGPQQLFA
jgi:hypothetical protein